MAFAKPIATTRSVTDIPTGRLGVWWLIASEIVIFGGLVSCYLLMRMGNPHWADYAAQTLTAAGALNTFVLLTSSLFIVIAHHAAEAHDSEKAFRFMWYCIGLGGVFLVVKAYEYSSKILHGVTILTNVFWSFYYTATGLHALHVIAGMVIMGIISFDVRKKQNLHRIELIGAYWHFVDIVWIFLFPLFYIAK